MGDQSPQEVSLVEGQVEDLGPDHKSYIIMI
jgi:hypothetical protein